MRLEPLEDRRMLSVWGWGLDYGDAPDPTYPTLLANDGARHGTQTTLWLGAGVDSDFDGQPDATATGDNADGNDDENGVTFAGSLAQGRAVSVTITASQAGLVDAWIDFDKSGGWGAGEQFLVSEPVLAGDNFVTLDVPADAVAGDTFARFRISSTGGLAPTGAAVDGEVEDYQVTIEAARYSDYNITLLDTTIRNDFYPGGSAVRLPHTYYYEPQGDNVTFSGALSDPSVGYRFLAHWGNGSFDFNFTHSGYNITEIGFDWGSNQLTKKIQVGLTDSHGASILTTTPDDPTPKNTHQYTDSTKRGTLILPTSSDYQDVRINWSPIGSGDTWLDNIDPTVAGTGFGDAAAYYSGTYTFLDGESVPGGSQLGTPPYELVVPAGKITDGKLLVTDNWTNQEFAAAGAMRHIFKGKGTKGAGQLLFDYDVWQLSFVYGVGTGSSFEMYVYGENNELLGSFKPGNKAGNGTITRSGSQKAIRRVDWNSTYSSFAALDNIYVYPRGSSSSLMLGAGSYFLDAQTPGTGEYLDEPPRELNFSATDTVSYPQGKIGNAVALGSFYGQTFQTSSGSAEMLFNFDVQQISFSWGASMNPIQVVVRDSSNHILNQFNSTGTSNVFQTLTGGNIRKLQWQTTYGTAELDNISIDQLGGASMQIIDDGSAGFTTSGNWYPYASSGFEDDVHYSFVGAGSDVASWNFPVTPGQYEVAATWAPHPNRATNAPYTVYDGITSLGTVPVNQQATPDDFGDQGTAWETLGTFDITSDMLLVELSDSANGLLIADAVRVERVGNLPTQIIDNGDTGFTTSGNWYPYSSLGFEGDLHYSFVGAGSDVAAWNFTVSPGRYQVAATWSEYPNRATNAPYEVYNGATSLGTVPVNQQVAPDDFTDQGAAWETLGTFTITGDTLLVELSDAANGLLIADAVRVERVGDVPPIIDNGDTGFTTSGNWYPYASLGFEGDLHYSFVGTGSDVAAWSFTVTPGQYNVAATWSEYPNRATNAPYEVYNGTTSLGTVPVNQQAAPDDFTDQGAAWETLGTFTITGDTLLVELSDSANGLLIADAVRIEQVGSPLLAAGGEVSPAGELAALTRADLQPIVTAAIGNWTGAGIATKQLEALLAVDFIVTDLPGTLLGLAALDAIYLDIDAAGRGWFIDPTPGVDEEFQLTGSELRAVDPQAVDRMDLLTVVSHELGHELGLEDLSSSSGSLMSGTLETGLRREPGAAELDALFPQL